MYIFFANSWNDLLLKNLVEPIDALRFVQTLYCIRLLCLTRTCLHVVARSWMKWVSAAVSRRVWPRRWGVTTPTLCRKPPAASWYVQWQHNISTRLLSTCTSTCTIVKHISVYSLLYIQAYSISQCTYWRCFFLVKYRVYHVHVCTCNCFDLAQHAIKLSTFTCFVW